MQYTVVMTDRQLLLLRSLPTIPIDSNGTDTVKGTAATIDLRCLAMAVSVNGIRGAVCTVTTTCRQSLPTLVLGNGGNMVTGAAATIDLYIMEISVLAIGPYTVV